MQLKCVYCDNWNWYSINQLDYTVTCDLCLKRFDFPNIDPSDSSNSRWAYRAIGPFALPDYARGGYSASLAIRFFAAVIGEMMLSGITWSPGQELTFNNNKKLEVDFVLWYQRNGNYYTDYPIEIIFGEAKTFGKDTFEEKDVDNMKFLAKLFPGSILVFATLRDADELTKEEIERIRKLAEWGRQYNEERKQSHTPVILLTGTELFTQHDLIKTWAEKSDRHKALIHSFEINPRLDNLRLLADLTQQLYLDMPPYSKEK